MEGTREDCHSHSQFLSLPWPYRMHSHHQPSQSACTVQTENEIQKKSQQITQCIQWHSLFWASEGKIRDRQTHRIRHNFTHWWHQYRHSNSLICHKHHMPPTNIYKQLLAYVSTLDLAACKLIFPGSHAASLTQYPMAQLSTRSKE